MSTQQEQIAQQARHTVNTILTETLMKNGGTLKSRQIEAVVDVLVNQQIQIIHLTEIVKLLQQKAGIALDAANQAAFREGLGQ